MFEPAENVPIDGDTNVGPEKFWLVTCTDARQVGNYKDGYQLLTRGYKYVHTTQASAEKEALRLAGRFKGYSFAVVESMAVACFDLMKERVTWQESYIEPRIRPLSIDGRIG